MRKRWIVLVVAALTALGAPEAATAAAVPDDVPGPVVLEGMGQATDVNNHNVVIGMSGATPARWEPPGKITLLPVPPGTSLATAHEITDSGFVIGDDVRYDSEGGTLHSALVWDPRGRLVGTLLPHGTRQTHAADVNEHGTVVGSATDLDGEQRAVRWDSRGQVTELRMLPGGTFSAATAVNDRGTAVGYSDVVVAGTHVTHAVSWDVTGRVTDLGSRFSADPSEAVDVNNAGVVVGTHSEEAIKWHRSGRITVLQPSLNARSYRPVAMNDHGVVLGQAQTFEIMVEHPIRWDGAGQVTDLVGDYFHTWASAMNNSGIVVGTSDDGWHMPGVPRQSQALRWGSSGTATNLSGPVGDWNSATGINDEGVVCGTSGNTDGSNMHAVLWRTG